MLSNFLAATGPVRVRGLRGQDTLSADTVVPFTEQQQYALYPDNAQRKHVLVRVLHATADAVLSGSAPAADLARAMSTSAEQHRVLVWTTDRTAQRAVDRTDYSGTIPRGPGPFAGMVLNNTAAGKLDYYLRRSLSYHGSGCNSARDVIVTISLTNNAPASGLPPYVDTRLDHPARPVRPGDNHTLLDYYATPGAQLSSVTVDGRPATSSVLTALGHPVYRLDLELPRGTTHTVVLHLTEPPAADLVPAGGDPAAGEPAGAGVRLTAARAIVSRNEIRVSERRPSHCPNCIRYWRYGSIQN